jgi:hypothetical protein
MKLLPYDKFCITTSLTPAQVEEQLQMEVAPKPGWGFKALFADTDNKYFTGVVENNQFDIIRVISNRNSFLPVIKGHTESWLNGSMVYVKMRLNLFVAAFMCFWLGVVGIACIGILIGGIVTSRFSPAALIPFGMFIFGYAMAMGFYSYERNKAKEILLQILNGKIDNSATYVG